MQLRFIDEDMNHHLKYCSYFKMIEECLMNYDIHIANNKYLNYSMSVIYWKETAVNKYNYCFVNIYKKNKRVIKNDKNNNSHIKWDCFGLISVCKCCQRKREINYGECHVLVMLKWGQSDCLYTTNVSQKFINAFFY